MSYTGLEDIDEKSTIYPMRIAFAFLSSATVFSFVAVLSYIKEGKKDGANGCEPAKW